MKEIRTNWRAFSHRNYRISFAANLISNLGFWVGRVAQAWLVLQLTNSGTYLGILAALQFIPFLLVILIGGYIADRFNKRNVLMITNGFAFFVNVLLGLLIITEIVQIWHVMFLAFLQGLTDGIDKPVRQSFVGELVGLSDIANAISLNSTSFNLGRVLGPAISGTLIATLGTGPAITINGISFLFVLIAMLKIRESELFIKDTNKDEQTLGKAFRYVRTRPDLYVIMSVCFFMGAFGLHFEIFNILMTTKEFELGSAYFGFLGTCLAIGTFFAALISSQLERFQSTNFVIFSSVVFSSLLLASSFLPTFESFATILPFVGAAALTTVIAANSTTQLTTDQRIRGRVLGIYQFVFIAGAPLATPIIGWSSEAFGIRQTIAGCALMTMLPVLCIAFALRNRLDAPVDNSIEFVLSKD